MLERPKAQARSEGAGNSLPAGERPVSAPVRFTAILAAGLFGIVLAAILAETTARLISDDGMHFNLEMWKYAKDLKQVSDMTGIGHEHIPGRSGFYMGVPVKINAMGLRDHEYALDKPAQAVRILMLGDSITFGWGVELKDTPAKKLEALLNAPVSGPLYEVINSGVGNYNTSMEVAYFLHKGYRLNPDIVVLNYFINDAEPTPKRHSNFLFERSYAAVVAESAADTIARSYLGKSDWRKYYADLYRPDSASWAQAIKSIQALADYCRSKQIGLLIVNYPELHELRSYPFQAVTNFIAEQARANGAPFVDLLPSVQELEPKTLWVSPGDAHPNAIANEEFAKTIAAKLKAAFPLMTKP